MEVEARDGNKELMLIRQRSLMWCQVNKDQIENSGENP